MPTKGAGCLLPQTSLSVPCFISGALLLSLSRPIQTARLCSRSFLLLRQVNPQPHAWDKPTAWRLGPSPGHLCSGLSQMLPLTSLVCTAPSTEQLTRKELPIPTSHVSNWGSGLDTEHKKLLVLHAVVTETLK